MAKNVRTISINLNAGTAKFFSDMDAAGAKVREFGGKSVSSLRASSAAIRLAQGDITDNVRAVESFLSSTLKLGPVLAKAFPLVGAIAFGGLIEELGTKVYGFFEKVRTAGEQTRGAFSALNAPLKQANDELAVANDRLANDIAKLEGRHENTLKLALDEARLAADRLGGSLDKDLESLHKLLKDENVGAMRQILGESGTEDLQKLIGGDTGFGGFRGDVARIQDEGQRKIDSAKSPADIKKAQDELEASLKAAYAGVIATLEGMLTAANQKQAEHDQYVAGLPPWQRSFAQGDQSSRIEQISGVMRAVGAEGSMIGPQFTNERLTGQKDALQGARDNAAEDRPFDDWKKKMDAQIAAVKASMEAIGKPEAAQITAKAFGAAAEAIAEVNKALERHNETLTKDQETQMRDEETVLATLNAQKEWNEVYAQGSTAIADRVRSQDLLTAAIGKGYDATRAANVETRLMQELGAHYSDSAWMAANAGQVATRRGEFGQEFDAEQSNKSAEGLQKLNQEIALEKDLAAAQMQGAEAVRQAALAGKLRQMALTMSAGEFKKEAAAEMELYAAQRQNAVADEVAKINEKIEATQRLTAAILKGAVAVREANLANELAAIAREGDTPVPGVIGIGARGLATIAGAGADHSKDIADTEVRADRLRSIDEEIAKLHEAQATTGDTLALEIQLRDLENQRLHTLVEESLALKGAKDGVRAFFIEMQEDAKSAASIIYDSLNQALEQSSDNLAKMALGDKPKKTTWGQMWGKEFKGIGEEMVSSSIKSAAQKGLGALGKHFGIDTGGKPDGTDKNPLWVRIWGGGAGLHTGGSLADLNKLPVGTIGKDLSLDGGSLQAPLKANSGPVGSIATKAATGLAGFFGKLLGGGGAAASDTLETTAAGQAFNDLPFGGFMAEGGAVSPDQAYIVGDRGPEVLMGASGRIASNAELSRTFGGGGGITQVNHIDARGADLGARNRIQRALEMTHRASVASAVQANAERAKRTPQRSGR